MVAQVKKWSVQKFVQTGVNRVLSDNCWLFLRACLSTLSFICTTSAPKISETDNWPKLKIPLFGKYWTWYSHPISPPKFNKKYLDVGMCGGPVIHTFLNKFSSFEIAVIQYRLDNHQIWRFCKARWALSDYACRVDNPTIRTRSQPQKVWNGKWPKAVFAIKKELFWIQFFNFFSMTSPVPLTVE